MLPGLTTRVGDLLMSLLGRGPAPLDAAPGGAELSPAVPGPPAPFAEVFASAEQRASDAPVVELARVVPQTPQAPPPTRAEIAPPTESEIASEAESSPGPPALAELISSHLPAVELPVPSPMDPELADELADTTPSIERVPVPDPAEPAPPIDLAALVAAAEVSPDQPVPLETPVLSAWEVPVSPGAEAAISIPEMPTFSVAPDATAEMPMGAPEATAPAPAPAMTESAAAAPVVAEITEPAATPAPSPPPVNSPVAVAPAPAPMAMDILPPPPPSAPPAPATSNAPTAQAFEGSGLSAASHIASHGVRNARVVVPTSEGAVRAAITVDQASERVQVTLDQAGELSAPARARVSELRRGLAARGLALDSLQTSATPRPPVDSAPKGQGLWPLDVGPGEFRAGPEITFDPARATEAAAYDPSSSYSTADEPSPGDPRHLDTRHSSDGQTGRRDAQSDGDRRAPADGAPSGNGSETTGDTPTHSADANPSPSRTAGPYDNAPPVGHLLDARL